MTNVEQAIGEVVRGLPPERAREVLDFAQWLKERVAADAAADAWDEALENTTPEQAARIQVRIESQRARVTPLFDASGTVAPPEPSAR